MEAKAAGRAAVRTRRRLALARRLAAFLRHIEPSQVPSSRLRGYLGGSGAIVLDDVPLAGRRVKVSHLIVGPAGVTVVDSRLYAVAREARFEQGQLRLGRRNRTALVDRVLAQADAVRDLLGDTPYADVRVEAAIALRKIEGEPIVRAANGRCLVIWGTQFIAKTASRPGPLSSRRVDALAAFFGEIILDNARPARRALRKTS
jgi:hypothetical protein